MVVAFITLFIFSFGVLLGITLDNKRISVVEDSLRLQELAYKSLQFQYLYVSALPNASTSCPVFEATLQNSIKDLNSALESLQSYKSSAIFNQREFELLSQSYILENFRYWFLAKRTKELCNTDIVTVLYFYSDESCPTCPDQGTILSYYKRVFQDSLRVFPINLDFDEDGSVQAVVKRYDIDSTPTLVVDDDKYEGVISKESLKPILCSHFTDLPPSCIS